MEATVFPFIRSAPLVHPNPTPHNRRFPNIAQQRLPSLRHVALSPVLRYRHSRPTYLRTTFLTECAFFLSPLSSFSTSFSTSFASPLLHLPSRPDPHVDQEANACESKGNAGAQ